MQVIASDKIKGPKLPPFEERSDDIDSYLKRFKRHTEAHNWHKTIWATHLSALLKGNALDAHVSLPSEHVKKTALAKVYIDSPYFVGEVIEWCLQNPLYDVFIGNVEGAIYPNDPELNHEVGVVSRIQTKNMAQPYNKLKVPNSISHVSVDDIKSAQQSDESLVKIGEQVKSEAILVKGSSSVKYYVKKGSWFREFQSSKVEKGKVYCQLLVPKQNRSDVMRIAHESIMVGHLTTRGSVDRFTAEFYRPGITSDIKRYCRSCDICQRTVPKRQQIRAPLGKIPVIDIPFRRVSVDIVGPLVPITDKGNRYILTLVDYATRYPEAVALPSI